MKDTPTNINKFLLSTEKTKVTTKYNEGDHQVSVDGLKAASGIEPLSSDQDMALMDAADTLSDKGRRGGDNNDNNDG